MTTTNIKPAPLALDLEAPDLDIGRVAAFPYQAGVACPFLTLASNGELETRYRGITYICSGLASFGDVGEARAGVVAVRSAARRVGDLIWILVSVTFRCPKVLSILDIFDI